MPGLIALVALAMLAWTWGTWTDPFIDGGRELYVAWRIAEGARLYIDVASFNGPLSPHVNALWFRLLGNGLQSLVIGNLVLLTVLVAVIYRVAREVGNRASATVGTLVFVLVFAFGEYDQVGNYNYVTPYSHELVHGLISAFVLLTAFFAYMRTGSFAWLVICGAMLGCALLTKPEVLLAAAGTLTCVLPLAAWSVEPSGRRRWIAVGLVPVSALLIVGLAVALLAHRTGWAMAISGVMSPYLLVANTEVTRLPFYEAMTGRDAPWHAFRTMAGSFLGLLSVMGGAVAGGVLAKRYRADMEVLLVGATIFLVQALMFSADIVSGVARCWPLVGGVWLLGTLRSLVRRRAPSRKDLARLAFGVFSMLMLLKVFLNVRLYRYGFALAMPATLLVVITLVSWLPAWSSRCGASARAVRNLAIAAIATVVLLFGATHRQRLTATTWRAGDRQDTFYADERARPLMAAVRELQTRLEVKETVTVFPTGVMLNYLSRRRTPVMDVNYMPPELAMYGETAIVDRLSRTPPDYVVIVDVPTQEYGVRTFGVDYGTRIACWVRQHYQEVWSAPGTNAPEPPAFSLRLLRRRGTSRP